MARYLEDYAPGQTFGSGRLRVDKERVKAFAAEFDPQPFHLDRGGGDQHHLRRARSQRLAHGRNDPCVSWSMAS